MPAIKLMMTVLMMMGAVVILGALRRDSVGFVPPSDFASSLFIACTCVLGMALVFTFQGFRYR